MGVGPAPLVPDVKRFHCLQHFLSSSHTHHSKVNEKIHMLRGTIYESHSNPTPSLLSIPGVSDKCYFYKTRVDRVFFFFVNFKR